MTLPLHGFQDWQNPLHTADLQTDVNFQNINAGGQFITSVFDMRPYQSYYIQVAATSNVNPPTGYGNFTYRFGWYANDIGSQIVYSQRYSIFPQGVGGGFASALGRSMHRGPVMGPYMTIELNNLGPDQLGVSWRILGNTKPAARHQFINTDINGHQGFEPDLGLFQAGGGALGAGGSSSVFWPMVGGQMSIFVQSLTQPFLYQAFTPAGSQFWFLRTAAAAEINSFLVAPRAAARVQSLNIGGGLGTATVIGQADMSNDR